MPRSHFMILNRKSGHISLRPVEDSIDSNWVN
jgi:hypothetical protein